MTRVPSTAVAKRSARTRVRSPVPPTPDGSAATAPVTHLREAADRIRADPAVAERREAAAPQATRRAGVCLTVFAHRGQAHVPLIKREPRGRRAGQFTRT
ncbi:hypothetical protein ACIQMV_20430 [Streptomyces sp. NPDC091412]|uniref:hypothetical protein n=1 Tax=Streptomyces sp. NPDC091412 TaxID=3366002 RepID=UPI003811A8EF